jgi:hypothetical protein
MKTRYFFDIRSEGNLYPDEEGLELANEKAAEVEAANSLAGLARDSKVMHGRLDVAIEVRSAVLCGPYPSNEPDQTLTMLSGLELAAL